MAVHLPQLGLQLGLESSDTHPRESAWGGTPGPSESLESSGGSEDAGARGGADRVAQVVHDALTQPK